MVKFSWSGKYLFLSKILKRWGAHHCCFPFLITWKFRILLTNYDLRSTYWILPCCKQQIETIMKYYLKLLYLVKLKEQNFQRNYGQGPICKLVNEHYSGSQIQQLWSRIKYILHGIKCKVSSPNYPTALLSHHWFWTQFGVNKKVKKNKRVWKG